MAAEFATPVDPLTRLPLPIVPIQPAHRPDWHHHFHPRRSPLLEDLGGQAVRSVRVQSVDYKRHHLDYHNTFVGPPLPESKEEQFSTVIMAATGYMPPEGIGFKRGRPRFTKLKPDIREQLYRQTKIESKSVVSEFIRQYVLAQEVEAVNINESTIDEFLTTEDADRRRVLGHTLLGLVTDKATEQVNETYQLAHRNRLVLPGLPNDVQRFAKTLLGNRKTRDRLVDVLHSRLLPA